MNIRQKKERHHYQMGILHGIFLLGMPIMLVVCLFKIVWIIMGIIAFVVILSIMEAHTKSLYEEGFIMSWLKRALGIRIIAMKCQALAEFLGVDFKLIPEHYKCIKQK